MNSFEMHPDHFWGKTDLLEAVGVHGAASKPGGKSFLPDPGDQSPNTQ